MRIWVLAGAFWAGTMGAQAPVERISPDAVPPPVSVPGMVDPAPPVAGYQHQPPGAAQALANLTSQPGTRSSFTLDRDMLEGFLGEKSVAARLGSVTVENVRYHQPAFYVPESMHALIAAYDAAGWKHLVEQKVSAREEASPNKPLTDLWLHFHGADIDHVAVLVRGPKNRSLVEVSGDLRPLDLVHLGGRFGIPKVDPGAVMVPAEPGH